ncbi:MAG: hypothetical protein R2932_34630 [Caldilineaceae bacterium]
MESFGGHNHYHRNLTYYTELLRTNGFAITASMNRNGIRPRSGGKRIVGSGPFYCW